MGKETTATNNQPNKVVDLTAYRAQVGGLDKMELVALSFLYVKGGLDTVAERLADGKISDAQTYIEELRELLATLPDMLLLAKE